ncbi:ATP-binding protein [Anaerobacillus sp. MEB173]|uniref:ATP-binding protein n=1 Tax=Anaerobacillus sp. MEB173 TaxID=3383345 RepID=UPI003F8FC72D
MRKLLNLPIRWKITGLAFGIVLFSLLIGGIILLGYMMKVQEEELSHRSMITAQLVAQINTVQEEINAENASEILQPIAERIRVLNNNDYIVILNMDRIRLTHPIKERIHTRFAGGDEDAAFAEHIYLSKAKSDNGHQTVRAFVPIINEDREQVGVVVVGNILPTIFTLIEELKNAAIVIFIIVTLFGMWGAWLLANHIKRQTFHMEPDELARVLVERNATFNAIDDGVIAIDDKEDITVINQAAMTMLNINGNVFGKKIRDVIPGIKLTEILRLDEPQYQKEFYIENRLIMSNRIPITVAGETVGAVAIFRDKTDVTRLAEELTGVQAFVDALRVRNHEFSNKLHTIAGLLQLGQGEKALDYIFQLSEEQSEMSHVFTNQIHDDSLVGLLLGKVSRGKELGIQVAIDKNSVFLNYPDGTDIHDMVVTIGNLIDNSFDALLHSEEQDKKVEVLIKEQDEYLLLQVEDNGSGISENIKEEIFVRGFSTKEKEGRGIGLFLVKAIVDRVDGILTIDSEVDKGTRITIKLPMKRRTGDQNEQTT